MVQSLIVNFSGQAVGSAGLGPKLPQPPHVTTAFTGKLPILVDTKLSANSKSCAKAGPVSASLSCASLVCYAGSLSCRPLIFAFTMAIAC
jgi:hypothetical protein